MAKTMCYELKLVKTMPKLWRISTSDRVYWWMWTSHERLYPSGHETSQYHSFWRILSLYGILKWHDFEWNFRFIHNLFGISVGNLGNSVIWRMMEVQIHFPLNFQLILDW